MSWKENAKKITSGRWIRFDADTPEHVLFFVAEPVLVHKTVQKGPRAGEQYDQMSFPVREDGEDRILEPNRSLLTQLIAEDDIKPILGRTLAIRCLDLQSKRNWRVTAVGVQSSVSRSWTGDEPEEEEEPEEVLDAEPAPIKERAVDPEKEKFMRNVQAHAEKEKSKSTPRRKAVAREGEYGDAI